MPHPVVADLGLHCFFKPVCPDAGRTWSSWEPVGSDGANLKKKNKKKKTTKKKKKKKEDKKKKKKNTQKTAR